MDLRKLSILEGFFYLIWRIIDFLVQGEPWIEQPYRQQMALVPITVTVLALELVAEQLALAWLPRLALAV